MNWKATLHSILAVFSGGAATAALAVLQDPATFTFDHIGETKLLHVSIVGGAIAVLGLWVKPPAVGQAAPAAPNTDPANQPNDPTK